MALIKTIFGGRLAVVEEWTNEGAQERIQLMRSFEGSSVPVGHYALGTGESFPGAQEAREALTTAGYSRWIGNPRVVAGLLTHRSVSALWWRHNMGAAGFIREFRLADPRPNPISQDDLVVLTGTSSEKCASQHGRWLDYRTASRAELDRAVAGCAFCLGMGIARLSHFEEWDESTCACTSGRVVWTRQPGGTLIQVPT